MSTGFYRLRLYLIRHGEVECAADGRLLGRTDRRLSDRGISQAQDLAEELSRAQLKAVYSDLQRAKMTAEIIASRGGLEVDESSAWREIDMGGWEGRTVAAWHEETPELIAQVFNDPTSGRRVAHCGATSKRDAKPGTKFESREKAF